jgi:hypothetical protein
LVSEVWISRLIRWPVFFDPVGSFWIRPLWIVYCEFTDTLIRVLYIMDPILDNE